MVTAIATEKGALDDQTALTMQKDAAKTAANGTLGTKKEEFDTAKAAYDNRPNDDNVAALEQAKNDA